VEDDILKKIIEATQKKIKNIELSENQTIIEFMDGETITLQGGKQIGTTMKSLQHCSYCGKIRDKKTPMISPDHNDNVLICPRCAIEAVQIFAKSGVDLEIDLSFLLNKK
jgi:hypothetical protein